MAKIARFTVGSTVGWSKDIPLSQRRKDVQRLILAGYSLDTTKVSDLRAVKIIGLPKKGRLLEAFDW